MSAYIRIPSKSRVTGVTRVTTYAKRPNSLALTPVTRWHGWFYTRCNAAQMCNAKTPPHPLMAEVRRAATKQLSLSLLAKHRARDQALHDEGGAEQ